MATFTSVPRTTSSQFKHYEPTLLKRTKSKAKAKVTGYTTRRDHTEEATCNLGLLHQDTEGDLHAVPQQTLQVQAAGHIADVPEIDSAMCGLFGADHEINMDNLASGDSRYQFGCELLDEGVMDYATRVVATSDSATNGSLDRSSRGFYLIGESDAVEKHSTVAHEGDHVRQRGDLDAAVEYAFSVGDNQSRCHSD
ncbi:hypothetical protein EJ02DRAFT_114377 [Clathrospora elynae]|uniref:Uncharacterized protein n=1 Tax=Clathrospora elynae TaxID=706981 RepID=A0A6A5SUV6_9PLEO|nr:hypothetical protein EJ02DRAFT_114377 [Clathrospora elynae]